MKQTFDSARSFAQHRLVLGGVCSLLALACGGSESRGDAPAGDPTPTTPVIVDPEVNPEPAEPGPVGSLPDDIDPGEPAAPEPDDTEEPVVEPEPEALCDDSMSFDDLYTLVENDLRIEGDDGVTLRYISLTNRLNQGICPENLDSDRAALLEAVNSLSTELGIGTPEPIDADETVYRIDLGDYGWDQATVVDGVAFTDKWEAIIATSPYAVEFEGDEADQAKLAANTAVPLLFADALMDAALVDNLYYALIGIGESEDELLDQLGIDEEDDIVLRAGTSRSRLSRQDTVTERLEVGTLQGYYWARYDIAQEGGDSVFADPLGFEEDSIAAVFSLPNGLNGYALFDGAGVRVTDTDVIGDQVQRDGRVRNAVSCSQCHTAGVIPLVDEVREYVAQNPLDFDADTIGDVEDEFLTQPEIDDVINRDAEFFRAALARAGLEVTSVDPMSAAYVRFDGDVTLAAAAGELGVTPSVLDRELGFLSIQADPTLSSLRTQPLRREQFDAAYLAALCVMQASSGNRPLAADCAEVGQ